MPEPASHNPSRSPNPSSDATLAEPGPSTPTAQPSPQRRGRSFLKGVMRHLRRAGHEVAAATVGRWLQEPEENGESAAPGAADDLATRGLAQRVNVLHDVTEKLRGAADHYIAAKLDELEARVDAKLDHIERRMDDKIVELHQELASMRDRELRHRLRLLKITLIFTVLVALLSLVYKWISTHWI